MDVDKVGGTFVVTNDMFGDLPTYLIVDELPKQGETDKRYIIQGENGYKVYCWRTDGYDLIDAVDTQGWIRCKDLLPYEEDMYLVSGKMKYAFEKEYEYFIDFADYRKESIFNFKGEFGGHFGTYNDWYEGQDEYEILAWMPLPDPLEE